jgi:hypothetical protein
MPQRGSFDERICPVVSNSSVVSYNEESECFSSLRMLHASGRAFVNTGDGRHLCLDLGEAHTEAASLYELSRTSFDPEVSLRITRAYVTRLEPALFKFALRRFGGIEVSPTDRIEDG